LQDFFNQTVGPVKDVLLSYDPAGRSKGVATVNFTKKGDGNKAFQSYNNRLIDGS
jgi:THO complex subunit 4